MIKREKINKEIESIYKHPVKRGMTATHDMKWFENHCEEFIDRSQFANVKNIKAELKKIRHEGHVWLTFLDGYIYGIYRSGEITISELHELRKYVTELKLS